MEEGAGANFEVVFCAAFVAVFGDGEFIECAHRAVCLADCGAERCEIVAAQKVVCPRLHGGKVEGFADLPHKAFVVGDGRAACDEAEVVCAFQCSESGVEIIFNAGAVGDGDGVRFKVEIQRLGQTKRVPIGGHVQMCHLAGCVNACVGAARPLDALMIFL